MSRKASHVTPRHVPGAQLLSPESEHYANEQEKEKSSKLE